MADSVQLLKDSHKYRLWEKNLIESGLTIHSIQEIFSRRNGRGDILFSLLLADATTPEGHKIPPICFLKGEVVCVLVCLIDQETREKYLLLVKQRRICNGGITFEHPAGMLDSESDAAAVAAREIREETGIGVANESLVCLTPERLFPSTGTSDEAMYLYFTEIELPLGQIQALDNQNQGEANENEFIQTCVLPFAEGHRKITNVNGLLLNFLYLKNVGDFELLAGL